MFVTMKKVSTVIVLFLLLAQGVLAQGKNKNEYFTERYRPQFHFSVPENQMGSPVILHKTDSLYHLYVQHNPFNLLEGFIHWSLATSPDLLHWQHKGIALSQPDTTSGPFTAMPWWGSLVKEHKSSPLFFNRSQIGLHQAKINTNGLIIDEKLANHDANIQQAEPFVFWYEPQSKYVMLAYNRNDSILTFYQSSNTEKWEQTGILKYAHGLLSLYQMNVDRKPDDTRWVLFGEKSTYSVGQFDGKIFLPESEVRAFDANTSTGGSVILQEPNRTVLITEIKSSTHADLHANGQLTFPSQIALTNTEKGVVLVRKPIDEIAALHQKKVSIKSQKIYPGLKNRALSKLKGDCFHIKLTVDLVNSDYFGLNIRAGKKEQGTEIGYNIKRNLFSMAGVHFPYQATNHKLNIEILIDRSSIELYLDGGIHVASVPFTPDPASMRYEIFTNGGEIVIENMEAFSLKSVWQ